MKYGQIAESIKINEFIYHCFQYLDDGENEKFVREFRQQPHDKIQVMHTFRELILGAYLSQSGLQARHNCSIDSKTPDWCILDHSGPKGVIELVNFHPAAEISKDIADQMLKNGIWCNFLQGNTQRLYHAILEKTMKYKALVTKYQIPYVVSVFGEFDAFVDSDELEQCLFDKEGGIFNLYSEIAGVLYFEESSGTYFFSYLPNPTARFSMSIPAGKFQKP